MKDMAKRQNFVVGSTNAVTETMTTSELNHGFDRYEVLTADKLDGTLNSVSDYSNDSSNEIANAIQSITGTQPTGTTQTELADALQQMRNEIETTSLTFKGYVATSEPSSSTYALVEGNLWINSATMPTSFPVAASSIKQWNGTSWVNYGSTYTPADFDFFRNINDNEGYYWFGGMWTVMSTDMSTTYFTLNQSTGKWEIKSSVNLPGSPTTTTPDAADQSTKIATTQFARDFGQRYVSNCITEIPQDINLTLSNGTLTLKSGSKVYFGDGSSYTTTSDKTRSGGASGKTMIVYRKTSNDIVDMGTSQCYSGTTQPTGVTYAVWFDTTNNIVKWTNDGFSTWQECSFPVCLATFTGGVPTSIDQIFNGLGYIGSTEFVLPNVAVLIPNGRNADGTLNNIKYTTTQVATLTINGNSPIQIAIRNNGTLGWWNTVATKYNEAENLNYYNNARQYYAVVGKFDVVSSQITNFEPHTAFHAVDYSDLSTVALSGAYNDLIGKPTDLFDVKWSDHLLDNTSWLRADNFSWNSGVTYSVAYNHLVADIAGKTLQSETISGTTVQFYLANDGHKICPASEESNVLAIYNATGVAWYYIIDSANTRFKLPRTKFGMTGLRDTVGKYVEAGLPNITSSFTVQDDLGIVEATGAMSLSNYSEHDVASNRFGSVAHTVDLNATDSSSIYGNSTTVQAPATQMYLYFYVGSFTQTALENTAGLNASLFNGKADVNLLNTANNVDFVIESQEPTAENDYTWYRKYKSGWVEQGGVSIAIADYETATITLPVAMSNINYTLTFGNSWDGTNDDGAYIGAYCERLPNRTTTSFQLYSRSTTQRKISFVVSGKAA